MIAVKETEKGFERIEGNPVLLSLDGKRKARLRVILHESWTAKDRAAYGVHLAEPFSVPDGKRKVGHERFEQDRSGQVKQVFAIEDIPQSRPEPKRDFLAEFDDLKARVAALESKR